MTKPKLKMKYLVLKLEDIEKYLSFEEQKHLWLMVNVIFNKHEEKWNTNNPQCELCGTSLEYWEEEGRKTWWQCPKCNHVENVNEW